MTPSTSIQTTATANDAHVLTAFQAACAFGRKQYDERTRWKDYDVSNAIRALVECKTHWTSSRTCELGTNSCNEIHNVIGGGNSLTGRIKWLIENRGAMTRSELDDALNADTTATVASLKYKGVLSISGRGVTAKVSLVGKAVGV